MTMDLHKSSVSSQRSPVCFFKSFLSNPRADLEKETDRKDNLMYKEYIAAKLPLLVEIVRQ